MVAVAGQQGVVVEVGLGRHGQLSLEQHGVESRRSVTRTCGLTGEELTQVLLVETGVEEVGVGVVRRRLRRTNGDVGTAVWLGRLRL